MELRARTGLALVLVLAADGASPAWGLLIDDFSVPQMVSGPDPAGFPVHTEVAGGMLGGARTMYVGGVAPASAAAASVDGGTLSFVQSAAGQRLVDLVWRVDEAIDLTEGGSISAFQIELESFRGFGAAAITVASDRFGNQVSSAFRIFEAAGPLRFDLAEFVPDEEENENHADITSIISIGLRVQTFGEATLSGGLSTVPEPSAWALLALASTVAASRGYASAKRTWLKAQSATKPKAPATCQSACIAKNG